MILGHSYLLGHIDNLILASPPCRRTGNASSSRVGQLHLTLKHLAAETESAAFNVLRSHGVSAWTFFSVRSSELGHFARDSWATKIAMARSQVLPSPSRFHVLGKAERLWHALRHRSHGSHLVALAAEDLDSKANPLSVYHSERAAAASWSSNWILYC